MPCSAKRDAYGTSYHIAKAEPVQTPGGLTLPGCPAVDVWWSRDGEKAAETLIIRQSWPFPGEDQILELSLGQVYDLMHALGHSVLNQ